MEGGTHWDSVGQKDRDMGVAIVEAIILPTNVVNRIRSLGCLTMWPTLINKLGTI